MHGLMPVPVAGKIPLGGAGWNTLPLEVRLRHILADECTGVGIQMGLVFHPVLGPVDARTIDCDINDATQRNAFAGTLQTFFQPTQWRWGRRPATLVFTDPGVIKNEKFGPVQLLGNNKQVVWWGAYLNRTPEPNDPLEYLHQGPSIFDLQPPRVPAEQLRQALEASVAAAGYSIHRKSMLTEATPLSTADLSMLTPQNLAQFQSEIKSMLIDVEGSPIGSGRGTKLFSLGLKYGALIKASGTAPLLTDAMYEVCPNVTEYETVHNPILAEIGGTADQAFSYLRGTLGAGDRRDLARGVGASMGLSQNVAVQKAKQPLPPPSGRGHPGQTAEDLMNENIAPLKFLVNRFIPDCGCVVLAGKPKIGKGWIVLELAMSIAEGGKFWGEACTQAEVLMYMLEDSKRRVKERINILRPFGFSAKNKLRFRYSIDGPFAVNSDGSGSLLDDIKAHLASFPAIKFIVVDVLQRIRGVVDRSDNAYQMDYKVMGAIQNLATEFNVFIIVVHHLKKGRVDDAIDSVNGSFGVSGSSDGAIIIGRDGDIVKIESRMRDLPDFEFEMTKESGSPMWKPAVTAQELFAPSEGTKTQSVMMALQAAACCLGPKDIVIRTGLSERNVATYLGRLVKSNQATRPSRGWYMAVGLKYRERVHGAIDMLKRYAKTPATSEVKARYAPNGAPEGATYMMLTAIVTKELEGSFDGVRELLSAMRLRGLISYNSDTVWFIGDSWDEKQPEPEMLGTPFSLKMPWETV